MLRWLEPGKQGQAVTQWHAGGSVSAVRSQERLKQVGIVRRSLWLLCREGLEGGKSGSRELS